MLAVALRLDLYDAATRLCVLKDGEFGPAEELSVMTIVSLDGEVGNSAGEYAWVAAIEESAACAVHVPVLTLSYPPLVCEERHVVRGVDTTAIENLDEIGD